MQLYLYLLSRNSSKLDIKEVTSIITSLPVEHTEIIYSLILYSFYRGVPVPETDLISNKGWGKNKTVKIPYSGKILPGNKGIRYQVDLLPEETLKVVSEYIDYVMNR